MKKKKKHRSHHHLIRQTRTVDFRILLKRKGKSGWESLTARPSEESAALHDDNEHHGIAEALRDFSRSDYRQALVRFDEAMTRGSLSQDGQRSCGTAQCRLSFFPWNGG